MSDGPAPGLAAALVRAARQQREISQRELAVLAHVPRSTIDRIESGATDPRLGTLHTLFTATELSLCLRDPHRRMDLVPQVQEHRDRAGRHFPAHLRVVPVGNGIDLETFGNWWGWERIAWPLTDDWRPEHTYWKRRRQRLITWDDATSSSDSERVPDGLDLDEGVEAP